MDPLTPSPQLLGLLLRKERAKAKMLRDAAPTYSYGGVRFVDKMLDAVVGDVGLCCSRWLDKEHAGPRSEVVACLEMEAVVESLSGSVGLYESLSPIVSN